MDARIKLPIKASFEKEVSFCMKGTVTLFKSRENFGFIESDEMDDDVFFHVSELEGDSVNEGDEVEFDQEEGDRGPKATNVTVV